MKEVCCFFQMSKMKNLDYIPKEQLQIQIERTSLPTETLSLRNPKIQN